MKRTANKTIVPCLVLAACAVGVVGCTEEPPGIADRGPFRDGWQVEVDADFLHTSINDEGKPVADIFDMTIGGREDGDNFANRGDIIVNFDGPANRILVEMRRFTFSTTQQAAEEDFENLSLWAFASSVGRPQDQDPLDNCDPDDGGAWQNACQVRVYYDGLSQLERSGADLRVTLPPEYRQKINIVTQDNIEEEDYLNRGNVCVSNLFASADIEVESGRVWATLSDVVTPAPKCSQEQIDKCENWTVEDDMGNEVPAAWAQECDCIAVGGGEFGRLEITSRDETAADITIDIPTGLWTTVKAENTGEGQQESGDHCDAVIEAADFVPADTGNDFSWQKFGSMNYPGMPAISGAGFSIVASSSSCEPVAHTEHPDDFVGTGKGDEQASEERGNVRVCNDCITQSCNDLIP